MGGDLCLDLAWQEGEGGATNGKAGKQPAGRDWQETGWATSGDGESVVTRLGDGSAIVAPTTAVKSLLLQTLIPFVCVMMKARRWGGSVSKQKLQHNIPCGYLIGRYEECHPSASSGAARPGREREPTLARGRGTTLPHPHRSLPDDTALRLDGDTREMQQHAGDATAAAQRSHHRRKPAHRSRPRAARSWESTNRQAVVHRHQMDGISLDGRRCRRPPLVLARCLDHRGPSKAAGTVNPSSAFHSLASRNGRELPGETQFHARHPNSNCRCRCPVDIQKLPLPFPKPNAAQ